MKVEVEFDDMGGENPTVVFIAATSDRRHIERVVVPKETAKALKNAVDTIEYHMGGR